MARAHLSPALQKKLFTSIHTGDVVEVCNLVKTPQHANSSTLNTIKPLGGSVGRVSKLTFEASKPKPESELLTNLIWANHSVLWKSRRGIDKGRHSGRLSGNNDDDHTKHCQRHNGPRVLTL